MRPASNTNVSQPTHPRVTSPEETGNSQTPVPSQAKTTPTSGESAATDNPEPEASTHFGIGVAAHLDIDRAREENDRFVRDTTLPGVVMPYKDDGTTMYRVVLGRWATAGDAERAANVLMERSLISEARVVTIPLK